MVLSGVFLYYGSKMVAGSSLYRFYFLVVFSRSAKKNDLIFASLTLADMVSASVEVLQKPESRVESGSVKTQHRLTLQAFPLFIGFFR